MHKVCLRLFIPTVQYNGQLFQSVYLSYCREYPENNNMAEMAAPVPVTEWPEWSVYPDGGDPFTQDLNSPYDKGDLCWLLVCTILCW